MNADELIDVLDFRDAPGFLDAPRWHEALGYAHVFRRTGEACRAPGISGRFRGVYMLGMREGQRRAGIPVVFVCEAPDEAAAERIHRIAWNQSTTPFLIIYTPTGVRLYSGFDYDERRDDTTSSTQRGVLEACVAFDDVAERLAAFRAAQIDDGTLWERWGHSLDPSRRVDVHLLRNLDALGKRLQEDTHLERSVVDSLIGRFVYLRYLRDRKILTDDRLRQWNLEPYDVFGRTIALESFQALLGELDRWLNGSLFPLPRSGDQAPTEEHVRFVAGAMLGDEIDTGQLHLDFRAYDFSHIPIELLSSIYEQFMARRGGDREVGAFYTPLPLVNFVIQELDDMKALTPGMRVFDPSCGSGTYLVRCFQLLIEKQRQAVERELSAIELRSLLTDHIFGLDRDEEACRVTEFSLALALLDEIPDEALSSEFKLPDLHERNIRCGDFFDSSEDRWDFEDGFDWIIGNPPWVKAKTGTREHSTALEWIAANRKHMPVCGNQLAEAFAWKATTHLRDEQTGIVALVIPAMTFFEKVRKFRETFFSKMNVIAVANLANLREVLFRGRARLPASVVFYTPQKGRKTDGVFVYSPLVVNQEVSRPSTRGQRRTIWSITVDHSEIRHLRHTEAASGDPLPWKTSMWGSTRDLRLLRSVAGRHQSLREFAEDRLRISEGLQLRSIAKEQKKHAEEQESLEHVPEVTGRQSLDVMSFRRKLHVHSFPEWSLTAVPPERSYVRKRGGTGPLSVCRAPHIIVSAARNFSVYSDKYIVVPPRQIGISGAKKDAPLLRALSLYLSSSFVRYHQFLISPQEGIRGGRGTLDALFELPIPFQETDAKSLRPWIALQRELSETSDKRWSLERPETGLSSESELQDQLRKLSELEREIDELTFEALGISERDRWLVDDLINVRLHLIDGKSGEEAAGRPTVEHLNQYADALRDTLDAFLDEEHRLRHAVTVVHEQRAGVARIEFKPSRSSHPSCVEEAESRVGAAITAMRDRLDRRDEQWLYFNRNLVTYLEGSVFIWKPMQRLWWTRSQALSDADQIIADLVASGSAA